jgi:pilus assembly protein CpaC
VKPLIRQYALLSVVILPTIIAATFAWAAPANEIVAPLARDVRGSLSARSILDVHSAGSSNILRIIVGHSVVLTTATPLRRVYIGNPDVLQSFTSSSTEIVITAIKPGISSLVLWDSTGNHCLYSISADVSTDKLLNSIKDALPGTDIQVDTREGMIYLSGTVPSDAVSGAVVKMASAYGKDIVSSLRVIQVHEKQVQLKLRIVEVDRTKLDQFGVNFFLGGKTSGGISTQQFNSVSSVTSANGGSSSATVSDPLNLFLYNSSINMGVTVKDLEQRQILQVLAEPTLTAISGQQARFLSGGEFPYPVVESGGVAGAAPTISISFRPYGVKVDFMPTVNADGTILLKLSPEVSALDYSNAVTISGFTIPALSTRRAETEVELQSGQSFMVSGLLDHRTTEIMSRIPGVSSLPVLGQLFRSKDFSHSVVELVVIVTATVVDPLVNPRIPAEPSFPVPNMNSGTFDSHIQGGKDADLQNGAHSGSSLP